MPSPLREELKLAKFASIEQEAFLNLLRTTSELSHGVATLLRTEHLSMPQYNALRILRGAAETGLRCREVGARLISPVPDVTRLLDRLEVRGLVTRVRQSTDRRVVTTRITDRGLEVLKRLDDPLSAEHTRQLGSLGTDKLGALIGLLEEIRSGYRSETTRQSGTEDVPHQRGGKT
jgi:DNA-binding MarR family transcriptional regulator